MSISEVIWTPPDEDSTQTELDLEFLNLALNVANRTDDPQAIERPIVAVGAAIARDRTLIATSANQVPPQLRTLPRYRPENLAGTDRYDLIEHAERSAIYDAARRGVALNGASLYCTRFPCAHCARAIVGSGIARLIVPKGARDEASPRWEESQAAARVLLKDAGVKTRFLAPERD